MNKTLIFVFSILLFGCAKDAKESVQNGNFKVELLFEHDGCKVYRFADAGRYVYWSDCHGRMQFDKTEQVGKTIMTRRGESITSE